VNVAAFVPCAPIEKSNPENSNVDVVGRLAAAPDESYARRRSGSTSVS